MNKKVQLNDMELNQVAGGGFENFLKKLWKIFEPQPIRPIHPIIASPSPKKPVTPIVEPFPIFNK